MAKSKQKPIPLLSLILKMRFRFVMTAKLALGIWLFLLNAPRQYPYLLGVAEAHTVPVMATSLKTIFYGLFSKAKLFQLQSRFCFPIKSLTAGPA
jgi:hypothetical protein